MDYSISSVTEDGVLVMTIQGRNTEENALEIMIAATNIMAESKSMRVLIDLRLLKGRVSFGSVFFLLREVPHLPSSERKVALVDLDENRDYAYFHQLAAANVGMDFTYFFDYDQALSWLREQQ